MRKRNFYARRFQESILFAGFSICERKTYDSFKSEEIDYKSLLRYDTVEFDDADAHRSFIYIKE